MINFNPFVDFIHFTHILYDMIYVCDMNLLLENICIYDVVVFVFLLTWHGMSLQGLINRDCVSLLLIHIRLNGFDVSQKRIFLIYFVSIMNVYVCVCVFVDWLGILLVHICPLAIFRFMVEKLNLCFWCWERNIINSFVFFLSIEIRILCFSVFSFDWNTFYDYFAFK